MEKNKISITIIAITLICIFSVAAFTDRCSCSALTTQENQETEELGEVDSDKKEGPSDEKFTEEESLEKEQPGEEEKFEVEEKKDSRPVAAEYGIAFGIDYRNPDKYLNQGEQSQISDFTHLQTLYSNKKGLDNLENIYHWLKDEFTSYSAGGRTIGEVTADELLEKKSLGGCHDYALVYAAVAREIGYPAVMVRTSSIVWIESFKIDEEGAMPRIGHVFAEVYLDKRWILIDPTNGWYLKEGYCPSNPVIPLRGNIAGQTEEIYGFYVEKKGLDIWDMGIHNQIESGSSMDELARRLNLDSISYPDYNFKNFSG